MKTVDVLVIGAGLSGLTAAYRANRNGQQVSVLEAFSQVGGMIRTYSENGFTFEAGPHTFPSTASAILDLCKDLGLKTETAQAAHNRYLFLNQQLTALPAKPPQFITSPVLSPFGKIRLLQEPFISKTTKSDVSIAEFFSRRLGNEATQHLVDPFISGIYAGDIRQLSLPAVFPRLWEWEQSTGSIIKGALSARKSKTKRPKMELLSFSGGLQTLTDALHQALPKDTVHCNQAVARIEKQETGYIVHTRSGEIWQASKIVLATPAFISATLLENLALAASKALSDIPYTSLNVVHFGFDRNDIPHDLNGFGFLVPSQEKMPLLGCIWASSLFPDRVPQGRIFLSCFIGGEHHPEIIEKQPEKVEETALKYLTEIFQSKTIKPLFRKTLSYPKAIPQYTLGHRERVQSIEDSLKALPGLTLCGNYLHGIALNQCVQSGLEAVKNIG